jgi:tetratricopeptide (TPR) repeat protein
MMTKKTSFTALTVSFVFLLTICFSISAAAQPKLREARNLVEQGDKAYREKNYREAADQYAKAIVLVPNSPEVHFKKGYAHFYLNEYDPALSEFGIALTQGANPLGVYRVRSEVYLDQKNYAAAVADIEKGLTLAPGDSNLLKKLGETHLAQAQYPAALDAFKKAAAIDPRDGDLDYNIARVQFEIGDAPAQETAARTSVDHGTRFMGDAYRLLGDACEKQKKIECAIDSYEKSLNAKPDQYAVYVTLADIYRNENRFTDAINITKRAMSNSKNDEMLGNLYSNISWYYSLAERSKEAIAAAQSGIRLLPKQALAYTNLCRAYNDTKQYPEAITACNGALLLSPKDGETLYYLGRAYDNTGKKAEAKKYYNQSVGGLIEFTKNNPTYSDGFYLLGNAYSSTEQFDKALESYKKCLELSPKFVWARHNIGSIYVFLKNKAGAMEQYDALREINPTVAEQLKALIDGMK